MLQMLSALLSTCSYNEPWGSNLNNGTSVIFLHFNSFLSTKACGLLASGSSVYVWDDDSYDLFAKRKVWSLLLILITFIACFTVLSYKCVSELPRGPQTFSDTYLYLDRIDESDLWCMWNRSHLRAISPNFVVPRKNGFKYIIKTQILPT